MSVETTRELFDSYYQAFSDKYPNFKPIMSYTGRVIYFGKTKNGKRHGLGVYYFPYEDEFYIGEFNNGKRDGDGRVVKVVQSHVEESLGYWRGDSLYKQIATLQEGIEDSIARYMKIYKF